MLHQWPQKAEVFRAWRVLASKHEEENAIAVYLRSVVIGGVKREKYFPVDRLAVECPIQRGNH